MEIGTDENPQHWHEEIGDDVGNRLNWLRAGVLGANDGIVSVAGIVMGVAGATSERSPGLRRRRRRAGRGRAEHGRRASTSRSTPSATPSRRCSRWRPKSCEKMPETELRELARMYERKGLSRETAQQGRRRS